MFRLMATLALELAANAVGLIITAWLLPGFSIDAIGFIIVVGLFTAAKFILGPLMFKLSFKYVRALNGGVALVTTFVGLWVTTLLSNHLVITGFTTWVLATLIVWLCGVLAAILLPLFLFKKVLAEAKTTRSIPPIV
jgi:putative membrane protein